MINSPTSTNDSEGLDRARGSGPLGAAALAGIATAIVVAIWFAFYLFVFIPRAVP
jgi:hypothetical protein